MAASSDSSATSDRQEGGREQAKAPLRCAWCDKEVEVARGGKGGRGGALFVAACSHLFHFACIAALVGKKCPLQHATEAEFPLERGQSCPICFEALAAGSEILITECGHIFHYRTCMKVWDHDCPVCRRTTRAERLLYSAVKTERSLMPAPPPLVHHAIPSAPRSPPDPDYREVVTEFPPDDPLPDDDVAAAAPRAQRRRVEDMVSVRAETQYRSVSAERRKMCCLLHIAAREVPARSRAAEPMGADIVLVVDRSGSMYSERMRVVKSVVGKLIEMLGERDRLALVEFNETASVACGLRCMGAAGKSAAREAVDKLEALGGTNIADGLALAMRGLAARRQRNKNTAVVLLTDGLDETRSSEETLARLAVALMGDTVTVSTVGIGRGHACQLCSDVADLGSGIYAVANQHVDVPAAVGTIVGGILSVVVQRLRAAVEPEAHFRIVGARGSSSALLQHRTERGGLALDLGVLYSGGARDILFDVECETDVAALPSAAVPVAQIETACTTFPQFDNPTTHQIQMTVATGGADGTEETPDVVRAMLVNEAATLIAQASREISAHAGEDHTDLERTKAALVGFQRRMDAHRGSGPVMADVLRKISTCIDQIDAAVSNAAVNESEGGAASLQAASQELHTMRASQIGSAFATPLQMRMSARFSGSTSAQRPQMLRRAASPWSSEDNDGENSADEQANLLVVQAAPCPEPLLSSYPPSPREEEGQ